MVALALAAAMAAPAAGAGVRAPKVVGGATSPPADWGWAVALAERAEPSAAEGEFCSGTRVAPTVVVTAAPCLVNQKTQRPVAAARIDVVTGRINLRSGEGQRIAAAELRVHPDYRLERMPYDVGVVILAEPSTAPLARLPDDAERRQWRPGQSVYVAGWGYTRPKRWPFRLQVGQIPVRQDWLCALVYGPDWPGDSMTCAGGIRTATGCPGDSGGPLMARDAAGGLVFAGITSTGSATCTDEFRPPGAYVDIAAFDDWILAQIPGAPLPAGPEPPDDATGPRVRAEPARGKAGADVNLPYRVHDNSGTSREIVRVYVGDTVVKRIRLGNGPAAPAIRYRAVWHAPRRVPAKPVRFCVTSYDPSGNRGRRACAPIRLRV